MTREKTSVSGGANRPTACAAALARYPISRSPPPLPGQPDLPPCNGSISRSFGTSLGLTLLIMPILRSPFDPTFETLTHEFDCLAQV